MTTVDAFITQLEVRLGVNYTDEQRDFIKSLDTAGICFASPGTGKTASAVAGLLTAELYKSIPGENIYALSFTNMATLELSVRHLEACKKLGVSQRITFKTLHSLCSAILKENYRLLGMDNIKISGTFPMESMVRCILGTCESSNINLEPRKARSVVRAIRTLNSSLTFERENVESKACFKETGLTYDEFQELRYTLYNYNKQVEMIQVDDIMLYTLELLLKHPEVSDKIKARTKVMLIDEAQDMSLLQLGLASKMCDNLVLIGDIKQQIYAFNGACQEIVEQFYKLYPNAWTKRFTQSFRCLDKIADFATKLILPNHVGGEDFKGRGEGGIVEISDELDYSGVCEEITNSFFNNGRKFDKGVLFLFRNNYSVQPVAEEFFKRKMPFRVNHYVPVTTMPVMKELVDIVNLAINPSELSYLPALAYLCPELKEYADYRDTPFYRYMKKNRCDIFRVPYKFKNDYNGEMAMSVLTEVKDMYMQNAPASDIFNKIYPLYYDVTLRKKERYMEQDAKYYLNLASYVVRGKTFDRLIREEIQKAKFIEECNERRLGVRCFTFHSAKGLEDDIVYMIDCDEGIIPNKNKFQDLVMKRCNMDAAREVRNERSLVYVAATRAKEELHIYYQKQLSSLLTTQNNYLEYDIMYESFKPSYNDVEVFKEFTEREVNV